MTAILKVSYGKCMHQLKWCFIGINDALLDGKQDTCYVQQGKYYRFPTGINTFFFQGGRDFHGLWIGSNY